MSRAAAAIATVCIIITAFSTTANAGTEGKNGPMVSLDRPFDWSGFYIGGNVGGMLTDYDFGHFDTDVDVTQQFFGTVLGTQIFNFTPEPGVTTFEIPHRHETTDGSAIGGGQIGYQRQFGHFVVGVEGDFDRASIMATSSFKGTTTTSVIDDDFDGGDIEIIGDSEFASKRKAETNWTASARGKVGFAQGPLMFYGTGGVAWANVTTWSNDRLRTNFFADIDSFDVPVPAGGGGGGGGGEAGNEFMGAITSQNISRDEETRVGWTAGGGIEWGISQAYTIALEYRHTDFGSETLNFNSHNGPIFPGSTSVDMVSDQVTLRCNVLLSHLFGHQDDVGTTVADSSAASAKDKNVAMMPAEEPFVWSGVYIGGNVGADWTHYDFGGIHQEVDLDQQFEERQGTRNVRLDVPDVPAPPVFGFAAFNFGSGSSSSSGGGSGSGLHDDSGSDVSMLGGGQLGYQYQFGHFVVGVEGDFGGVSSNQSINLSDSAVTLDQTELSFPRYSVTNVDVMRTVEQTWRASARAKLGYAGGPNGRLLLYVTGGAAWTNVKLTADDRASTEFFGTGPFDVFSLGFDNSRNVSEDNDVQLGWTAGGGAEWAFTRFASAGLEYRHNGFGDHTYSFDRHNTAIYPGSTNVDLDSDQLTFRVNILLGRLKP